LSFPITYRAIQDMMHNALLETPMARDIVRKAGPKLGSGVTPSVLLSDLLQEYSVVQYDITGHEQYGSLVSYDLSAEDPFPSQSTRMMRFWDFEGIEYIRLVANISEAGPTGGILYVGMAQGVDGGGISSVTFEGGAPSVPADTVGLHVSEWRRVEWLDESLPGRPAQTLPWLTNPTGSPGEIGVGLIQIQVKGA
jgi:hypothetical protein